jgi:hypothetical protein
MAEARLLVSRAILLLLSMSFCSETAVKLLTIKVYAPVKDTPMRTISKHRSISVKVASPLGQSMQTQQENIFGLLGYMIMIQDVSNTPGEKNARNGIKRECVYVLLQG